MNTATTLSERLVTPDEAAAYLRVSPKTLEAWRARGGGPIFVRLRGRAIRYRQSDLEQFITHGLLKSTSDVGDGVAKIGFFDRVRK